MKGWGYQEQGERLVSSWVYKLCYHDRSRYREVWTVSCCGLLDRVLV